MTPPTTSARGSRPRSLYRSMLSLAVAAVVAASIPFAAIYAGTPRQLPATAAVASAGSAGSGQSRLVTTASGRLIPAGVASTGGAGGGTAAITTRTSANGSD